MRILLFGATGMVGQGVLRECLRAPDVELVQTVGRTATGQHHPKLRDACFFCLGVPSVGLQEAEYTRLTHDLTLTAAQTPRSAQPPDDLRVCVGCRYRQHRARTQHVGTGQGLHGIRSKTAWARFFYSAARPLLPLLRVLLPRLVLTTEVVGQAMLGVARHGAPKAVLEAGDISVIGRATTIRERL